MKRPTEQQRAALAVLHTSRDRVVETSTYTSGLGSLHPVVSGVTAFALERHGWATVRRHAGDGYNVVAITDAGVEALREANAHRNARSHPAARRAKLGKRRQLAKAEVLAMLATSLERWRVQLEDNQDDAGWTVPAELLHLCTLYGLTKQQLARVVDELGAELEARADRAGYDQAWRS